MRRSTKTALMTAFGIATFAAQVAPYSATPAQRDRMEGHRTGHTQALIAKLESDSDVMHGVLYWMLEQIERVR